MTFLSDLHKHGFEESEIFPLLLKHGIDIGTDSEAAQPPLANKAFPEWKRVMSLHPYLTNKEAASVLSGIDFSAPGYLSDEEGADLMKWNELVERSILTQEIEAGVLSHTAQGKPESWSITPDSLAEWCRKKGIPYPLPACVSLPSTDAGLRDALACCEQERVQLLAKVTILEGAADQRAMLKEEIAYLRAELRSEADKSAVLTAERDSLKADALEGKARSTALKIIGGLLIDAYGMDIHAGRLEGIGELVKELDKAGVSIEPKTLSGYIKEAATLIEPKKKS